MHIYDAFEKMLCILLYSHNKKVKIDSAIPYKHFMCPRASAEKQAIYTCYNVGMV